ncbi:helix-turn-helix transcriptional regulator [Pseudomonas sp. ABC1]|uniref:helix-turn-helix transcriptional regulator n=1 Tax=Pseudomonas sp. ABC1 TaxID=2748080 RepID=UPI0015C36404|nr:helix-turn-helix transcriptional regulator [Pseudomonas sp. ABC1]QLF91926.1 helix-turn-helix transcriptional regulator [Pseudomonas sp. ABC1]
MQFSRHYLSATGVLFYWIDTRRDEMQVLDTLGVPAGFLEQYRNGMQPFDPMRVSRMVERHECVGVLSHARGFQRADETSHYQGYLHAHGVVDTIDLMFWAGDAAFGGVGFLKTHDDPPLLLAPEALGAIQRLLEASFSAHPHVQRLLLEQRLLRSGLSHREKQVACLIGAGASNRDVAEAMGIGLGTVKTYVVRIFDKLGVESRTALAAYLAGRH